MPTTLAPPGPADSSLADELHEIEAKEAALERRTRSLELSGPLALLLSILALGAAAGALAVALGFDSGGSAGPVAIGPGPGTAGGAHGMAGAGGKGRFSTSMIAAAARGTVHVQLGDYWVAPAVPSVRAGRVTFAASNVGRVPHELMVERMPIRFTGPMSPDEGAAQGMIEVLDPGGSGSMTLDLRPGRYMLFCNVAGHYAAGQHIPFTVTGAASGRGGGMPAMR